MRRFAFFLLLAVSLSLLFFGCLQSPTDAYSVKDGIMHYPENRPVPAYNASVLEDTSNHTLTYLIYQSHGGVLVHALLRMPKTDPTGAAISKPPVVILSPGATVPKEGRQPLARKMQDWGYATLALDVRGNGKTPRLDSLDAQLAVFINGGEPEEAQMVYDELAAFDLLSENRFGVDQGRVAMWGESMGGRYALIAAALEPKIKGVLLVSSAGYGFPPGNDPA
ncbi:alpha/beta hydrolase [Candidatus Micrarchaeota archaeon]|nr:alpha/beta hydrolase [Candidatus Micrarchaeota archaeon]